MKLKTPCRIPSVRSFLLAMASFSALALQAASTSYINSSGVSDTADCTAITSSTTTLETGWYVVEGQLSSYNMFTVSGDVNLILADNARFTIEGDWQHAGINVPPGSSLTIFAQADGTGELNVTGGYYCAGIGGIKEQSCGTVTINGGIVNVTGGDYGAAIGGGYGVSGDPSVGAGGTVTVNGGTVTAHGGNNGAGIGGGYYGNGGTVRVNGGSVTAISGGDYSAGIGKGAFGSAANGTLTVGSGLAVLAGASEATATTQTPDSVTKEVTLSGQKWFYVGQPSLRQTSSELYVSYHEATPINVSLADTIVGGTGPYTFTLTGTYPEWLSVSGTSLVGTPPATGVYTITLDVEDSSDTPLELEGGATYTLYVQVTGDVSATFVGENGASQTETCTVVEKTMTTLSAGWYVVYNDVVFNSTVAVSGDVKLVLMDGKTMTVTASQYNAAVNVAGTGNSLTIYGQSNGTGRLEATAVSIAAGIGGNSSQDGGTVTIYGGTVVATGASGAGIGGGYNAAGGSVAIYGGAVTANGGYAQGGIGGQSDKGQGTLAVGANVVVKAGSSANPTAVLNSNGETDLTSLLAGQRYFTFETVGPAPLAQTTSVLAAHVGEAFSQALSATVSGGTSPYSFEKTSGTLTDGLEFNAGVISGTPTTAGSATVVFAVTDSGEPVQITNFTYTINVTPKPKSITYYDGDTKLMDIEPREYTPGVATNLAPNYAKNGYSFIGWYDNDGLAGDAVTEVSASADDDLEFWGKWDLVNYTITYHNVAGGLTPTNYTVLTPTITLPTPEVGEGETFVGWYTTLAFTAGSLVTQIPQGSTGNKDFYAKITSNTPDPGPSGEGFIDDDPEEPASGYGVVSVDCQTASGVFQRKCKQLSSGYWAELNDSWYYVTGEVTIESVEVVGKASLILGDGATLTVGSEYTPGIQLTQGNTLTIYGQSGGTGVLIATGGDNCAGIGGGSMMDAYACGKLNIYGGNIIATGGDWAAGIGSTDFVDSTGQIYVYGGTVTAVTVSDYHGGIGGYYGSNQGSLVVGANMAVTAGADVGSAVELTPDANGVVTLSAQKYFHIESAGDLPLAQSQSAFTKNVGDKITLSGTISGGKKPYAFSGTVPTGLTLADGTLTCNAVGTYNFSLTVTDADSTVIQATYAITVEKKEKSITYIDGTDGVTVLTGLTPTEYTPGDSTVYLPNSSAVTNKLGYTFNAWYLTPELEQGGSTVYAIYSWDSYTSDLTFYAKFTPINYSILYYDHNNAPLSLAPSAYTITNTPVALPTPDAREGFTFDGWCENSDRSDTPTMTIPENSIPSGVYYKAFYAKWTENAPGPGPGPDPEPGEGDIEVSFVDENGDPMQQLCTVVTADTATFTNGGWYVVNADVERSGAIVVEGSASLVLVNNKSLTVQGESFYPGIAVTEGNTLAIYGQEGNSGTLTATGGDNGAGIGGGASSAMSVDHSAGTIIINGGTVVANGGTYSAGIGGGNAGNGGVVTVNGGSVTAKSTWLNTPGIGGGYVYSGTDDGTLTVAGKMAVLAGETSSGASERDLGTSTRTIEIDKSWGYFFIEERTTPVGTFWSIQYRDTNSSIINGLSPSQYKEGEGVSLAAAVPTKTGYTFDYWYEYGSENVPVTEIPANATGDKVFYAKWTATEFTIEYYLKGELVELSPSNYTVAAVTRLPEEVNGYYVKWHDNPELQGNWIFTIGAGSGYARNIKLYADADPIPYTITFYDSETGDQFVKPYLYMVGYNADYEAFDLPRTAHKDWRRFVDWYDNIDCTGDPVRTIPTRSFGNKKFYAKWEATTDPVLTVDADGNLVAASLNGNTEIEIPSTVRRIDTFVFYDFTTLEAVTIPSTVTNIDDFAFSNCKGLKQIELPESLRRIGWCAFDTCSSLESVYIPKGVTVGDSAFFLCESLKSVNIGGTVVQPQGRKAASGRRLLAAASLLGDGPEDPEAIQVGMMAFACCGSLESAKVGSKVEDIGGGVFSGCTSLDTIVIENNDGYIQQGNSLLTSDGATLVSVFGSDTDVTVASTVVTVKDGAFVGNSSLLRVVLPSGVETIGEAAFSNATAFATITIPSSVTAIGANAFCDTALATVYVAKGDKARVKALVEGAGYTAAVSYVELGDEPTDWPATPSSVAGQTASEAFGVTGELANAKADDLATWAKAKGVDFSDRGAIIPDAFLLDCANTAAAVEDATEDAEEAIAITAITIDENGVPQLTYPAEYGNGQVVVQGSATLGGQDSWHDGKQPGDFFFRTVLRLK